MIDCIVPMKKNTNKIYQWGIDISKNLSENWDVLSFIEQILKTKAFKGIQV